MCSLVPAHTRLNGIYYVNPEVCGNVEEAATTRIERVAVWRGDISMVTERVNSGTFTASVAVRFGEERLKMCRTM